jgi:crotonobetainyl-CoA:carnitine CoA-transferase CaiB-like acyl-CoA transferase
MVRDERLNEPRFATHRGRRENAAALAALVEGAFLSRTRQEIHAEASGSRLPLGAVWSPDEILADPHNMARALFEPLPPSAGDGATARAPRLPVLWNSVVEPAAGRQPAVDLAVGSP